MKKIILFLFSFGLFCSGCSNGNDASPAPINNTGDGQYFKLNVNGTDLPFVVGQPYGTNHVSLTIAGNVFHLQSVFNSNYLNVFFDKSGNILSVIQNIEGGAYGNPLNYSNYPNFPSNYFNIHIVSLDETAKRVKVQLSGNLYLTPTNLNSETWVISSDFDMKYSGDETLYSGIVFGGVQDKCSAKFNNVSWTATKESYGSFTSFDPYKLQIKMEKTTNPSAFDFTPTSTTNCIKFYKFNTATLIFDSYDVTGTVAYTYKEFHGANQYSFYGTFSFTAVNPNNPADVIHVTDGDYVCYL